MIPSPKSVRRSIEISHTYQVSFWDASIIDAAEDADCEVIFTEDLNTGPYYAGIEVLNPLDSNFIILPWFTVNSKGWEERDDEHY